MAVRKRPTESEGFDKKGVLMLSVDEAVLRTPTLRFFFFSSFTRWMWEPARARLEIWRRKRAGEN